MSKAPRSQKPKVEKTEAPEQDIHLGDLTPEFIRWHQATHSEEQHFHRYHNRIPADFAERFGIERV